MANTQVSPKQIKQDGASSNQVLAWNGSTWAPTTNGTGSVSSVDTVQPAAGLTITGGPITSTGTLTFALANDLAGLEGLSTTGLAVRTGDGVWATRSIVSSSVADSFAGIGVGNGDGSGNPTINVNTDNSTIKLSVEAATTANIALSGAQTIDGIALSAGQRCLVKNQSSGQENGIWTVAAGSWTRSTDYNTNAKAEHGLIVFVQGGTVNGNKFFKVDQSKPTIGTTPLTFTEVLGSTGDGNGIYSGSGTIATAAVATVASGSTFTIDYNGAADAILVSDTGSSTTIKSKNGSNAALIDNASVTLSAGSNSATLTSTGYDVVTNVGGPQLSLNASDALIFKGSQQLLVRANDSSLGTSTYYFQADSATPRLYMKASTSEIDIDSAAARIVAPYASVKGHNSTTQGELRLYEQSSAGTNYTAFKTQDQAGDITYILPATSANGLMINSSSTLSWGTASNAELASGVGGIYKGSGTIATAAVATLGASQAFTIDYAGGGDALRINDANESIYISNKDQDNYLELADTTATLSVAGTYSLYMQSNFGEFGQTYNKVTVDQENAFSRLRGGNVTTYSQLVVDNVQASIESPYFQIIGHNSSTPGELRFREQSSAGTNYTAFKAQNQAANITYTLPAVAPASDGHVLSATTAGVMSWVANGSGGNGIYGGSGTIATNAVATLGSGSTFTIDYNGASDAMVISDTLGSVTLRSKNGSSFMGTDANGSGIYSGSDAFTLSESIGGATLNTDLSISTGKLLLTSISTPTTFSANQNDFALSATAAVLRVSSDASRNLTGIANSGTLQEGRILTIVNIGSTHNIVLTSEDTNSTAANRFALGESNVTLKPSESITIWYDTTNTRWRPIDYRATSAGSGITSINGLTAGTQTFATGTSGTDFNIDSTTSTHTFHIPDASASNRGLVTTSTQTFGGNKTFNGTVSVGSTTPTVQSNSALTTATTYTIGNSSSTLNVGGSSGIVNITSSAASGVAITMDTSSAVGASTRFGTGTYTATSGTISSFLVGNGFAPTSGTGVYNALSFVNTLNQTGGANGITRLLYLNPTITAAADLRGIDIAYSSANAKGIYQSGASTTNNFVGRTSFGTTSAPHASAAIDVVTTSTGVGLPVMTSTQRDAISSPRQGLMIYNTTDDKVSVRRASDWVDVAPDRATINAQTGTTYTLVLGDAGKTVTMDNASPMTLTIPDNGTVAFPVGTTIDVVRKGAGTLTIAITSDTLRSASSYVKLASQYSGATLLKIAATEWVLFGNLSA